MTVSRTTASLEFAHLGMKLLEGIRQTPATQTTPSDSQTLQHDMPITPSASDVSSLGYGHPQSTRRFTSSMPRERTCRCRCHQLGRAVAVQPPPAPASAPSCRPTVSPRHAARGTKTQALGREGRRAADAPMASPPTQGQTREQRRIRVKERAYVGVQVRRLTLENMMYTCLAYLCLWGEGQQQVALVQPDIH